MRSFRLVRRTEIWAHSTDAAVLSIIFLRKPLTRNRSLCWLFCLLVLSVFAPVGRPQTAADGFTPSGMTTGIPDGSYSISAYENINLFNGRLNYSMPLISLDGRGTSEIPINLNLELNWTRYDQYLFPDFLISKVPNYNPGYLYSRFVVYNGSSFHCTAVGGNIYTWQRLTFRDSSGTEHELRDVAFDGEPRNHYDACTTPVSIGTVFKSVDGSGMTFVSDTAISNNPGYYYQHTGDIFDARKPMTGMLTTSNGTQYRINEGLIEWVKDRNGNKTSYEYTLINESYILNRPRKRVTKVTDSLNRQITIEYDVNDVSPFGLCDRITYTGFNGSSKIIRISKKDYKEILRSGYTPIPANQLFPPFNPTGSNPPNAIVPSAIWMPDGVSSYRLFYNPHIELARVESPLGTAVEYDYDSGVPSTNNIVCSSHQYYPHSEVYRRLVERRSYAGAASPSSRTTYGRPETRIGSTGCNYQTTGFVETENFDANNSRMSLQRHYFFGSAAKSFSFGPIDYPSWKEGKEYETKYYLADGITLSHRVLREWKNKTVTWAPDQSTAPSNDTRISRTVTIELEGANALAALETKEYDETGHSDPLHYSHLNLKRSKTYNYKVLDWNTAQSGDLPSIVSLYSENDVLSITEMDYLYGDGYKSRGILGLVTETRILNPTNPGDVIAKSQNLYDEQNQYFSMVDFGQTVGYEPPTGVFSHLRANLTTKRTWIKDTNSWLETRVQFDNFGNVRKAWDVSGDPNRFIETDFSSDFYYAYPTRTTMPSPDPTGVHGSSLTSSVSTTYDLNTGRALSTTDANGQITSIEYDSQLRVTRIVPPAGGRISEFEYGDSIGALFVRNRTQVSGQNFTETTTFLTSDGKPIKVQTKDRQGDIFVEYEYDTQGRLKRSSNPYRQGETKQWRQPLYDDRGRVVGGYAPAPDGQLGADTGQIDFGISTVAGYVGHFTTVTDASGRKRRSLTNAQGQVVRVDEPVANNDLGPINNPSQPSFYTYGVGGNLIKIQQGQQTRYFLYDSLGRLIRTRQPEQDVNTALNTQGNLENNQWTTGYTYDLYGNVLTVTDANNTVITSSYDKAGRITGITYSDGTPQVEYFYDGTGLAQAPQFSRGSVTKIANGVSESRFTAFDNYGRILTSEQITDDQTYSFGYKYDSNGNLQETTYPSGRIVRNFIDSDGALSAVASKASNTPFQNYVSNFNFAADGSVRALMLGNGRWETGTVNERGQATQLALGTSSTDTSLWRVNYEYGQLNLDGTVDVSQNTGLIAKQTITTVGGAFVQGYQYDHLNRLVEGRETAETANGPENWKQTFAYDRYGNRTNRYQKIGNDVLPINNFSLPQVDPATNRFMTGQGYFYDFNGNLVKNAANESFSYDGNDKQSVVRDLNIPAPPQNPDANVVGRYFYDGEGRRVKKVTSSETVIFVYDVKGRVACEYSTEANTETGTSFITTDILGSPRVITDDRGNVISRRDHMPFGEDLLAGVGARSTAMQYSDSGLDHVRQRFAGYEKDAETSLDFAKNRMYGNSHGRYTTIDPLLASASAANPQTFNRYPYAGNNPVNLVDPSGLIWCRNFSSGAIYWKDGAASATVCDGKNDKIVDDQEMIARNDWGSDRVRGGGFVKKGDTVKLHSDGTIEILSSGGAAQEVNEPATTGTGSGQAASNPASTAASDTGITELPTAASTSGEFNLNGTSTTEAANTGGGSIFTIEQVNLSTNAIKGGQSMIGVPLLILQGLEHFFHQDILADGVTANGSFLGLEAGVTYTRDGSIFYGFDTGQFLGTAPLSTMWKWAWSGRFRPFGASITGTKFLTRGRMSPDQRDSGFNGLSAKNEWTAGPVTAHWGVVPGENPLVYVGGGGSTPTLGGGYGIAYNKKLEVSGPWGTKIPIRGPARW